MTRNKAMASKKSAGKRSSSKPAKKQKSDESPLPIMAPMPLRVYDPSGGAPPQSVAPLQSAISTELSSSDFESTLEQAAVKEDVATTSKGKEPMTSDKVPLWLPKRAPSKVELPSKYRYQRRSLRIKDQVGAVAKDSDFVPKMVTLSEGESDKSADLVISSVATMKPKSVAKEKKAVSKQKGKKPEKKAQPKKPSKRTSTTSSRVKGNKFIRVKS